MQLLEDLTRGNGVPVPREQLARQAGVEVGQSAPLGEHGYVVAERLGAVDVALGHQSLDYGAVGAGEPRVLLLDRGEVPPRAHRLGQVTEGGVVGGEQVDVVAEPQPYQHVAGTVQEPAGRQPHPGGDVAEAEPGQPGAQLVAVGPLGLGHGEDGHGPAVAQLRRFQAAEDTPVALVEDGVRSGAQPVAGGPAALRLEDALLLEPGDRRARRRAVDVQFGQQGDQVGDGDPAPETSQERPVDRIDQRAGPEGTVRHDRLPSYAVAILPSRRNEGTVQALAMARRMRNEGPAGPRHRAAGGCHTGASA